jgi:hypothetical protein
MLRAERVESLAKATAATLNRGAPQAVIHLAALHDGVDELLRV